jgi:hypothetical protein
MNRVTDGNKASRMGGGGLVAGHTMAAAYQEDLRLTNRKGGAMLTA